MSYTKVPKPKAVDYLEREQGDYILLEGGGRIIIREAWHEIEKPTASFTKIGKPSVTFTKVAKPSIP